MYIPTTGVCSYEVSDGVEVTLSHSQAAMCQGTDPFGTVGGEAEEEEPPEEEEEVPEEGQPRRPPLA